MEQWITGIKLLKTHYGDDENKFFRDIEKGNLIPCYPNIAKDFDGLRILPPHCAPLRAKIARVEELKALLERTDDELLRGHFAITHFTNDAEEFERFKAEEGPALLEKLAQIRPEKEKEYEKLLVEIGPEEALSPSKVWRGFSRGSKDTDQLLKAIYFVIDGDQEAGQPATMGMDQKVETDDEMVQRLRREGLGDSAIAHKLKLAFPLIYPSRIGRVITEKPGITGETDAYRKRGKKLLK